MTPGSRVAAMYNRTNEVTEQYGTCNYGPNAQFWPALEQGGLHVTGGDADGNARIVEIDQHPFFYWDTFPARALSISADRASIDSGIAPSCLGEINLSCINVCGGPMGKQ